MPNRDRSSSPSPNKNPTNDRSRTPISPVNKNPGPTSDRLVPGPARRPSQMDRAPGLPSSQSQSGLQSLSGSTTNDTVVPNKSTMTEERIEVPYATESRDSLASGDESGLDTEEEEREKEQEREKERERQRPNHQRQSSRASSSMGRVQTISRTSSRMGNLANGRSRTPEGREELDDETNSPTRRKNASMVSNDDRASSYSNSSQAQRTRNEAYRDQPGFSQQNRSASGTSLSTATVTGGGMAATAMADLLKERKARTDAETKASGLERRLGALEKEVRDATEREKWERDRAKELEAEVRGHKEVGSPLMFVLERGTYENHYHSGLPITPTSYGRCSGSSTMPARRPSRASEITRPQKAAMTLNYSNGRSDTLGLRRTWHIVGRSCPGRISI